jgi:hypothetical protein
VDDIAEASIRLAQWKKFSEEENFHPMKKSGAQCKIG